MQTETFNTAPIIVLFAVSLCLFDHLDDRAMHIIVYQQQCF